MELNLLKLDLDILQRKKAINHLVFILGYSNDIGFIKITKIKKIEFIKKKTYSAKIELNFILKDSNAVVMVQSIFGSDPLKEMNTLINHHKLNMSYSNRSFTIKRYNDGEFIHAKIEDITSEIKELINSDERKIWKN